jgi:choline dehydrogenase-like flavoprotein
MFVEPARQHANAGKADICIIGGGAVGITLALELADSGLEIVVLESGGTAPGSGGRPAYKVLPSPTAELGNDDTKPSYFGGNTNYWFGNCRPFDEEDFEQRDWVPHSGWPIDREELKRYYERAQTICGLGEFATYDLETSAPQLRSGPVDVSAAILETRLVQTTPVFNFGDLYGERLASVRNVRILTGTHATQMRTNPAGDRVDEVETIDADGRRSTIRAERFILASGGVENARLLLASNGTSPTGVGNEHDLVGRFFMEHFFFEFGPDQSRVRDSKYHNSLRFYSGGVGDRDSQLQTRQSVVDARVWGQIVLSDDLMRKERSPALALWFRPSTRIPTGLHRLRGLLSGLSARKLPNLSISDLRVLTSDPVDTVRFLLWKLTRRVMPSTALELVVQIEQAPDPENRITLSKRTDRFGEPLADLSLKVDDAQRQAHARSLKLAANELGLKGDELAQELERKYNAGEFDFFWHHMGTTRMSDDPTKGVVDRDCRVHGVSNLFVGGSSVFPTGGTAAPTLTAVALAIRLADHIQSEAKLPEAELDAAMAR